MLLSIQNIKNIGYKPDLILDIGAYHGHWTKEIYPVYGDETDYYLIEGNEHVELAENTKDLKNVYIFQNTILNSEKGTVDWHYNNSTGDSMFKENTLFYNNSQIIKRTCIDLDSFIKENISNFDKKNIVIKMDCQGSEIPILKGCKSILSNTDFILLEIPFFGKYNENVASFLDHLNYMDSIGFIVYRPCELHGISKDNIDIFIQMDILFINKKHPFNDECKDIIYNI
jgi:FkbM family methyltransferase